MNKIYNYIIKYLDKLIHFLVCYFLLTVTYWFLNLFTVKTPIYSVAILVIMIGLFKEFYDEKKKKGAFDKYDLLADSIGIILGIVVSII